MSSLSRSARASLAYVLVIGWFCTRGSDRCLCRYTTSHRTRLARCTCCSRDAAYPSPSPCMPYVRNTPATSPLSGHSSRTTTTCALFPPCLFRHTTNPHTCTGLRVPLTARVQQHTCNHSPRIRPRALPETAQVRHGKLPSSPPLYVPAPHFPRHPRPSINRVRLSGIGALGAYLPTLRGARLRLLLHPT